jgi:TolA-binding protein
MSPRLAPVLVAALLAAPGCFVPRALGISQPGPNEVVSGDAPEQIYEKAQRAFAEEDWTTAADGFGSLWREHPKSPLASDAQFYEAESRYGQGKYNGAFEAYKRHLKDWPLSPHAPLVERRVYDMGTYTIEVGRHGFLGIFNYASEGIDMLDWLVSAFPHGDLADDALVYMANYEWENRDTRDAIVHLHELVDDHPTSEWALEARLRLAKAYRDINRGTPYDADPLRRSAAEYRAYIELVSADHARAREYATQLEGARAELAEVEQELGEKGLLAADFYLRSGHEDAARAELRGVVREFPKTQAAAVARERLGIPEAPAGGGDGR